jgi:pyridoxal phosphate-dependent aminotransferase EpsN
VKHGRDDVLARLVAEQVESRPIWTPVHTMPMYAEAPRIGGERAEKLAAEGLSIPCSVGLTDDQQARVIALLQ